MSAVASRKDHEGPRAPNALPDSARQAAVEAGRRSLLRLVSHELRTPLNSIIGFSEIIARELHGSLGDPRYQDYAEMVNASGLKLLKLVNDVIELIRLEAGVADLDIRSEDPSSAVEDAAETVGVEARARRVRFDIQSGPVPRIEADHRGLRIALVQLFQNAIACSPDGGTVRVRYRTAGEMTAIEIEDDGPSVPEQDVPRLSRPAAHDADALTRNSEGAMLGLPIARLLAEKMGGRLRLSSEPGAGLCAAIQLRTVENDRPDA